MGAFEGLAKGVRDGENWAGIRRISQVEAQRPQAQITSPRYPGLLGSPLSEHSFRKIAGFLQSPV